MIVLTSRTQFLSLEHYVKMLKLASVKSFFSSIPRKHILVYEKTVTTKTITINYINLCKNFGIVSNLNLFISNLLLNKLVKLLAQHYNIILILMLNSGS